MAKLKGHAVIELTDVNTGKKEVVEHDNIITNGATEFLSGMSELYTYVAVDNALLPIEAKLMCGIYLFDEALTESASNTLLPDIADAKLTGYAGNATSDGNDPKRGDFNSAESEALVNGYKFVWDFGTDDANGQIASLALTNYAAGYHGYNFDPVNLINASQSNTGNGYNNYKGLNFTMSNVTDVPTWNKLYNMVSYENGIVTTVDKISSSQIAIRKYKVPFRTLKMGDKIASLSLIDETLINYSDSNQNSTQTMFIDGHDGYYYGLYAPNSSSTLSLSISKINKTTNVYTAATTYSINLRRDGDTFYVPMIQAATSYQYRHTNAVIIGNNLCTYYGVNGEGGSGTYGIIKFPLSDPTNWAKIPNSEKYFQMTSHENCCYFFECNGNVFSATCVIGSDGNIIKVSDDFEPVARSNYYAWGPIKTDGEGVICARITGSSSISYYLYAIPLILESINNLDSPVLKTASKTMKITYTLTEAS